MVGVKETPHSYDMRTQPERGLSLDTGSANTLILNFHLQTCEKQIFVVYELPSVWNFLITAKTEKDKVVSLSWMVNRINKDSQVDEDGSIPYAAIIACSGLGCNYMVNHLHSMHKPGFYYQPEK